MWACGVVAALAALVAWSLWQRWRMLSASPFPVGVDGYFYPIQLRALLAHGGLAYPASPLAFYLLAPFAALGDPITGAKLGAAVYGAAIAVPAYGVGARLGGGRGAGLVAAALATTSVGSAYLTAEFVKNSIGLTVGLAALWLALAAADRPTRRRIAAALIGLAAAWATHKMAAVLVVAIAIPAGLAGATAHGRLRGRRLIYAIAGLVAAALAALALGAALPHRFLAPGDAALIGRLFSPTAHWNDPALVSASGELAVGRDTLLGLLLALSAIAVLLVGRYTRRAQTAVRTRSPATGVAARPSHAQTTAQPSDPHAAASSADPRAATLDRDPVAVAAAWPILLLAVVIGLPWLAVDDADGLGFRLRIAAFLPAALSAAVLIRAAQPLLGWMRAWRDAALAVVAALLVLGRQPPTQLAGEIVTHPALVSAALALQGRVPPGATLIIPERHIVFLVAWYTGAPAVLRPDGVPPAQRYRLLPLHFIRSGSTLDKALIAARGEPSLIPPLGLHPSHPNGLVLVAEATWNWLLDQLPPADRAYYAAWPTL
jgi:dolichyl-phosphate-mannose-protein mannosyltransferase